jgi:hypothetical protein
MEIKEFLERWKKGRMENKEKIKKRAYRRQHQKQRKDPS